MPTPDPVFEPQGALASMANDPMMRQMLQQQQEGRTRNLEQMERVRASAKAAEDTEEGELGGLMALAAAKNPSSMMVGGFGQLLATLGGTYGTALAAQKQKAFEREREIAGLMDKTSMPFGSGSMTAMTQAALNPFMNVGGVGLVKRQSGALAVPSNMVPEYNKLYTTLYKQAVEQKMDNPEQWAQAQAMEQLGAAMGSRDIAGGRGTPLPTSPGAAPVGGLPPAGPVDVQMAPVGAIDEGTGQPITKDIGGMLKQLDRDERRAVASGDYARATEIQKAKKALAAEAPAPSGMQYRDIPRAEMEKATGEVTGKELGKEYAGLQDAASASSSLLTSLGTLKQLYQTPNMPEGQLGEQLQGIRSSLKTLGIDVGKEVGAGDLASAIAGKMALLTRTAEGGNLMPGAMSDFEQRILRGLVPGLNSTAEGRAGLIDFLGAMAQTRIRLASEAEKLASANRGILPPEWYKRRERILLEERAKMSELSRDLQKRFMQGAQ